MTTERHQNLDAVGFAVDVCGAYIKRLRGKAADSHMRPYALTDGLCNIIVRFIEDVEHNLDNEMQEAKGWNNATEAGDTAVSVS